MLNTIKNGGIKSVTVQHILDTYGDRGDLENFLKAANPLPKDYGSLEEICELVRKGADDSGEKSLPDRGCDLGAEAGDYSPRASSHGGWKGLCEAFAE